MAIFFTADLHFGHKNVINFDSRLFETVEEMDQELIKRWNNKVSNKDIVYVLGDMFWKGQDYARDILEQLNGKIVLIKGNHDKRWLSNTKCKGLIKSIKDYDEIKINNRKIILSHYPIHFYNGAHSGAIMLYGHVHNTREERWAQAIRQTLVHSQVPCEMYNVCCCNWNYEPVTLDEILRSAMGSL